MADHQKFRNMRHHLSCVLTMAGRHYGSKRGHLQEREDEAFVDDLAFAALHAFAVPAATTSEAIEGGVDCVADVDENEIDLEEASASSPAAKEEDDEALAVATEDAAVAVERQSLDGQIDGVNNHDVDDVGEASDAESDVDLTEQLARMVGDENENEDVANRTLMTVNEIDAYQADLNQLQDQFQWNVALETQLETSSASNCSQWALAGSLQHHMVEELTVVVLSAIGGALLQEGSLLVIHRKDMFATADDEGTPAVVPLGRIFEVFGPVSQPLYSIRLALPNRRDETPKPVEGTSGDGSVAVMSNSTADTAKVTPQLGDDAPSTTGDAPLPNVSTTSPPSRLVDPWSKNGAYTKMVKACPKLPVYFLHDCTATKFLDTASVYRNSGRGCDASNIFDEEILDVQDYSDDEQERAARGQRKKKSRDGRSGVHTDRGGTHQPISQHCPIVQRRGTHVNPPQNSSPQRYYNGASTISSVPQGFYQGAPSTYAVYPTPHAPRGVAPPLPFTQPAYHPAIQPTPSQTQNYFYRSYPNVPPPPMPPAAQQQTPPEGDTVYYDFS